MFSFLGSILIMLLFAVLVILMFGISLLSRIFGGIGNLWNLFTGKSVSPNQSSNSTQNNRSYHSDGIYTEDNKHQTSNQSADQGHRPHSGGVFKDDEGTYVDFEEVKS